MEEMTRAEAFVRLVGPWLVHIIEAISVLFILFGVVRAAAASLVSLVHSPDRMPSTRIRLDLGRSQAAQYQPLPSYHHVADHGVSRITVRGGMPAANRA